MDFKPNFFLLGAAKCGTTTLHAYLDQMPDVCMSRPKEPLFFEAQFERGLDFYRANYFAHWAHEPVIGDARHRNLYLPYVPQRIYATNPDARLVAIVRNPIERCWSHWHHLKHHGWLDVSFVEAVEADLDRIARGDVYETDTERIEHARCVLDPSRPNDGIYSSIVDTGYYCEQLQRYGALFPAARLRVVLLEDLASDPEPIVNDLVAFLGLDRRGNRYVRALHENPARAKVNKRSSRYRLWRWSRSLRKRGLMPERVWQIARARWEPKVAVQDKPQMDAAIRRRLRTHFAEHNHRLGALLGRDLSHWV
jgi:hypothetical protein